MCCCFNRTQIRGLLQGFSFARTAPPCPASYGLVSGDGTSAVEHSHLLVAISLEDTAGESKGRRPHPSPLHCVEREQTERVCQQYPKGGGLTPALSTAWRGSRRREFASSIQRAAASPQPSPRSGEGADGESSPAVSSRRQRHF